MSIQILKFIHHKCFCLCKNFQNSNHLVIKLYQAIYTCYFSSNPLLLNHQIQTQPKCIYATYSWKLYGKCSHLYVYKLHPFLFSNKHILLRDAAMKNQILQTNSYKANMQDQWFKTNVTLHILDAKSSFFNLNISKCVIRSTV